MAVTESRYESFGDFYPYYLNEHKDRICRRLHFLGTGLVLLTLVVAMYFRSWPALMALPLVGYGFAWVGHFFFEHNKPATFKYPFYSLIGDFVMFKDMLTGRIPF